MHDDITNSMLRWLAAGIFALAGVSSASAGEVRILAADFHRSIPGQWTASVTLQHDDTGWDHYADGWRVVDASGKVLGERVLYHPHVDEQPFTRSLAGVNIPSGTLIVYVEAHDTVHGWAAERLRVDLGKAADGRVKVEAG
jgi:hypothetical protein